MKTATADLRTGRFENMAEAEQNESLELEVLAVSARDLLAGTSVCWDAVLSSVGGSAGSGGFTDVVLVSADRVYVLQRSADRSSAQIGIAERGRGIGIVLSETRQRLNGR